MNTEEVSKILDLQQSQIMLLTDMVKDLKSVVVEVAKKNEFLSREIEIDNEELREVIL